ncbi:MAG TPA: D-alanyl-D-alanine carboxypeptidase [Micromonosporaceae bacterium]|nr:D-alanyl-D-alanine carboxypeptidase [Micromonosporaceae bacterium]
MSRRLFAALIAVALAVPGPARAEASAVGAVATAPGAVRASAPAVVPCPTAPVQRPRRPAPPPLDAEKRAVGGPALATPGLAIPAGAKPPPAGKLSAKSWVVADLDTGAVLGSCGAHEYGIPASVQKLLLVATMMPRLNPAQVVQVTRADLNIEPYSSAVGLVEGGRYKIETLWLGLLLVSGNDAANVLARVGGGTGTAAGGVAAMNAEAKRLGAYQTHAATPSGLDGPAQFTSAYDLALIARVGFAREDFRRYAKTEWTQVPPQKPNIKSFQIQNDNQLIHRYPGALGGKTGYTDLARHSYVGAAERNGRRLVVTLLGAEAQPARGWQQGAALLDWGFGLPRNASVGRLVTPEDVGPKPTPTARVGRTAAEAVAKGLQQPPGADKSGPVPLAVAVLSAVGGTAVLLAAALLLVRRRKRRVARRRRTGAPVRG